MFLWNGNVVIRKVNMCTISKYSYFIAYLPLTESVENHEHKTNMIKRNVGILYTQRQMKSSANEMRCVGIVMVPAQRCRRIYMGTLNVHLLTLPLRRPHTQLH
jgi:hypothetical protein